MRKQFLSLALLFFVLPSLKAQWMYSFKDAQKLAVATNKLILIDFTASWCGPCRMMDANTWSTPKVQTLMKKFVSVKIDIDKDREIANRYSIRSIPDIFIVDANGEIIYRSKGYKDKNRMSLILEKYFLNTKFLQKELIAYYKKPTGNNALALAYKYIDFSIFISKNRKKKILKLSNNYIYKAKKLYKKEGNKHKREQQIALLTIYKSLVKEKFKKVITALESNFKEDEIKEKNKPLYHFLYFTAYMKLKNKKSAKTWYQKLIKNKDTKMWLLKSRKI